MRSLAYGIDFGTTNSIVSAWGSTILGAVGGGKPVAFWDGSDEEIRPHPSVVWYQAGINPVVGKRAKQAMSTEHDAMGHRFIRSVKRKLGEGAEFEIIGTDRKHAWEIAADIFSHLKSHAEANAHLVGKREKLQEAVVTIPVHFGGRARADLRLAMQRAGIRLQTFLHEPFAAMIGHFYEPETKLSSVAGKRVLVFDWGGGTLDVCIVEVDATGRRIWECGRSAVNDHAGDEFDKRLTTLVRSRFMESNGIKGGQLQVSRATDGRLWNECERQKITLSRAEKVTVEVPNFLGGVKGGVLDLIEDVTRKEFEGVIVEEIDEALGAVHRCLADAGFAGQPRLVDHVLMVGGSSNIPAIRDRMLDLFGPRVEVADKPDAVISRGAAIVAAEGWKPYSVRAIGVRLSDDTVFPVFAAGTVLEPSAARTFTFYCTDHRNGAAHFLFEEDRGQGNWKRLPESLSVRTNPGIEAVESLDRIVCEFSVSEDLTLRCLAKSSSVPNSDVETQIFDICFGLRLE